MKFKNLCLNLILAYSIFLTGCAYKVNTSASPALDIMSDYEGKLPGKYVLMISDDLQNIKREISTTSYVCTAHTYPIDMGDSLESSIVTTLQSVFEEMSEKNPTSGISNSESTAIVSVRLGNFNPKLSCSMGFWEPSCTGTTELSLKVAIKKGTQKLVETRVGATRTADGGGGMYCGSGGEILAESINLTIREVSERLAERLLNSGKIRQVMGGSGETFQVASTQSQSAPIQSPAPLKLLKGTGFYVGSSNYIITNYHLIGSSKKIKVQFPNGKSYMAEIVAKDKSNDVAFLKLNESPEINASNIVLANSSLVKPGDKVFTIGYPMSNILGDKPRFSEGTISSVYGIDNDPRVFQVSVPIQPGNSGGPLFNEKGEVIGITMASLDAANTMQITGAIPQNVNFAIKSSFITNMMAMVPESLISTTGIVVTPKEPGSLSNFIEKVKNNIVLIEAEQ